MEIIPTTALSIIGPNNINLWTLFGDISEEYIAGCILGWSFINDNSTIFSIKHNNITDNISYDQISEVLSEYCVFTNVAYSDISAQTIDVGYIGLWTTFGNLYKFKTDDFINAIIDICEYFDADFRDYILGSPFTTNINTPYNVPGYDIAPFRFQPKIPVATMGYYTLTFETGNVDYD